MASNHHYRSRKERKGRLSTTLPCQDPSKKSRIHSLVISIFISNSVQRLGKQFLARGLRLRQLLVSPQFTALANSWGLPWSWLWRRMWVAGHFSWNNEIKAYLHESKSEFLQRSWSEMQGIHLKPAGWHLNNCCKFYCMPWLPREALFNYQTDTLQITQSTGKA